MKKKAAIVFIFFAIFFCWAAWERYSILTAVADIGEAIMRLETIEGEIKNTIAVIGLWNDSQKEEVQQSFIDFGMQIHSMKTNLLLLRDMISEDHDFARDFTLSAEMHEVLIEMLQDSDDALEKIKAFRQRIQKDSVIMVI